MSARSDNVYWFSEIDEHDTSQVGKQGVHLATLGQLDLPIPPGFILPSRAYFTFLRENNLSRKISHLVTTINYADPTSLSQVATHIRKVFEEGNFSEDFIRDVVHGYQEIGGKLTDVDITLHSTLITNNHWQERNADVNKIVKGDTNLFLAIKDSWSTLFSPRFLMYYHEQTVNPFSFGMALTIQKHIPPDISGKVQTATNDKSTMIIHATYGVWDKKISPDEYTVDKKSLQIQQKHIATQPISIKHINHDLQHTTVKLTQQKEQKVPDEWIHRIAIDGKKIEQHLYFPQEIDFVIADNQLYFLKTKQLAQNMAVEKKKTDNADDNILVHAMPGIRGMVAGRVVLFHDQQLIPTITSSDIVVCTQVGFNAEQYVKRAKGLIIEDDDKTIIPKLHGQNIHIPVVIGAKNASRLLKNGQVVTINGTTGKILKGGLVSQHEHHASQQFAKPSTKIYVSLQDNNVSNLQHQSVDGVIINADSLIMQLGLHPKSVLSEKVKDYVSQLSKEINSICSAFPQREIIYNISNLTSRDYRSLKDGKDFEPTELNPHLGFRGAFRHLQDTKTLRLELEAVKKAKVTNPSTHISIALPTVRNIQEMLELKQQFANEGIYHTETCKFYLPCDIPGMIFQLDDYLQLGIDGIFINVDHLASLLLGVDPHNHESARAFDAAHRSVLSALEKIIQIAHNHHIPVFASGSAFNHNSVLLNHLVKLHIDTVCVSPTMFSSVRDYLLSTERSNG